MTAGETILKFTDYPFAYSFTIIFVKVLGFSISQNQVLILGVAGAIGTFFTLLDPMGYLIRKRAEERIPKQDFESKNKPTMGDFKLSSIKSRAITIEIDKITGLFYFIFIIIIFLGAVIVPSHFTDNLVIRDNDNNIICDVRCIQLSTLAGSAIMLTFLAIRANKWWHQLDNQVEITGFHQYAISNEYATSNSVENMTRAIEQNDWTTAKLWQSKIEEEIKYKKGKRELIIKSADSVFSPLHVESLNLENQINLFDINRTYLELPKTEWSNIISKSHNFMIEDGELRQRIHNFYKKIDDYNASYPIVVRDTKNMIDSVMSSTYQKRLTDVFVNVRSGNKSTGYPLLDCALFNVYPTSLEQNSTIHSVSVQVIEDGGGKHGEGLSHIEEIKQFESAWETIRKNIDSHEGLLKLKRLIEEIKIENKKLQEIYHKMIEWQWKV